MEAPALAPVPMGFRPTWLPLSHTHSEREHRRHRPDRDLAPELLIAPPLTRPPVSGALLLLFMLRVRDGNMIWTNMLALMSWLSSVGQWIAQAWAGFCGWWTTISWGDAPGWVGAILTSFTLFFAVYVLLSDRGRERDVFFKKVATYIRLQSGVSGADLEVTLHNANDIPVPISVLFEWVGEYWQPHPLKHKGAVIETPPGGQSAILIPLTNEFRYKDYVLLIQGFGGDERYRSLEFSKEIKPRKANRILRRGKWKQRTTRLINWFKRSK